MRHIYIKSLVVVLSLLTLNPQSYGAIKELSKTQKAYVKFAEYRGVKLSPSGKLAAVAVTYDNKSQVSVIRRRDKKVLSAGALGKDYNVQRFIWADDEHLTVIANHTEGYLKGGPSKQYVFTHKVGDNRLKKIFPKGNGHLTLSFFRVMEDRIIDGRYVLVTENKFSASRPVTQLKKLDIKRGELSFHDKVDLKRGEYAVDNQFRARIAYSVDDKNKTTFFTKDLKSKKWQKSQFWSDSSRRISVLGFNKANTSFYFLGDNKKTLRSLYQASIDEAGKVSNLKEIFSYPKGDLLGAEWDLQNFSPLYVEYGNFKPQRKYFSKSKRAQLNQALSQSFPGELVYMAKKTGNDYLVAVRSDFRPSTYYIFNDAKKEVKEFLSANEHLRGLPTSKSEAVEYKTRDGLRVNGFLYRPKKWNKNTPMVINIHGGPFGVSDAWRFDGDLQLLVSEGYSVMQLNYRGSGGRGSSFEKKGYRRVGTEMQNDLADGAKWAIKKGIVKKGNICLWGVSYGGYASIMSTNLSPDLFKCGIGFGGVYDWSSLLKTTDGARSKSTQHFWSKALPLAKDQLYIHSPVSKVKDLKRPVLILHGTEDVRVPVEQGRILKKELEKQGKNFKYQEFEDIGHWFVADQKQKNIAYKEILNFLEENLKNKKRGSDPEPQFLKNYLKTKL